MAIEGRCAQPTVPAFRSSTLSIPYQLSVPSGEEHGDLASRMSWSEV